MFKLVKGNGAGVFFDSGFRAFTFVDEMNLLCMEVLRVVLENFDVVFVIEEEFVVFMGVCVNVLFTDYVAVVFDFSGFAAEWVVVKFGFEGVMVVMCDG